MDISAYFKSIVEQDKASVVICDLQHTIIYMNPAAIFRYGKRGGAELVGKSLLDCHNDESCKMIIEVVSWFKKSREHNQVHTFFNEKENKDVYMVALRDDNGELIGYYEKHEYRNRDNQPLYDLNSLQ
ncbi:MAG: PAS domain-containing protein [Wujia sp.]